MSKSSSFQRWPAPLAGPAGALAPVEPEDVSDFDDDDEVALADEVVVFDIELEVVEGAEEASACRGGCEDVAGFRGLEGKAAGLDIVITIAITITISKSRRNRKFVVLSFCF